VTDVNDLQMFLADVDDPDGWTDQVDVHPEKFRLEDDSAAAWAMRKLRAARLRMASNEQLAAEERFRIQQWLDQVQAPLEREVTYFEAILTHYALAVREEEGRKSVSLPAGTVTTRPGNPKWQVDDDFVPWAKNNAPHLLRVKTEPALSEIKKRLLPRDDGTAIDGATGEVVPGVSVASQPPSATVSPDLG
jgi:hypothetical protein